MSAPNAGGVDTRQDALSNAALLQVSLLDALHAQREHGLLGSLDPAQASAAMLRALRLDVAALAAVRLDRAAQRDEAAGLGDAA